MNLTDIENKILLILHSQVGKVIKQGAHPTERTFPSVLTMCDAWHVASRCCNAGIDPEDAAQACKGLIQKKLVREYEINRMPSFVPVSYCNVAETTLKDMPNTVHYQT